jgi:hypothetical protein
MMMMMMMMMISGIKVSLFSPLIIGYYNNNDGDGGSSVF